MKILFTNCFQADNTGDNAIWKNMMRHLKNAFPSVEFTICSQKEEKWDMEQLREVAEVEVVPFADIDALERAEIVISQGGGYMVGQGMKRDLQYFDVAQKMGKPTFFSTQTFGGTLSEDTKRLARKVFGIAKLVVPREKASYEFITKYLGVTGEHIKMLPDSVFDIGIDEVGFPEAEGETVKIGIRGYLASLEFLVAVAQFADLATETMGKVVFIPIGHGGDRDDTVAAFQIAKLMKHESVVIGNKLTAEQLKFLVRDGILVSDRYHGIIYAASMYTPFVAMTPDIGNKMPGLLDVLNYPYTDIINTKDTTGEQIFEYALIIWQQRNELRQFLRQFIPDIKKKAASVYKYLINGINESIKK